VSKTVEETSKQKCKPLKDDSIVEAILKTSGADIMLKNRHSVSTLGEELDNETGEKNKNGNNNTYMVGSMNHISVFSIEDLSKIERNSEK
jgi:hypothetical protein